MREIKFRGFRNFKGNALYPPDKRWIYGYYYFNAGEHWIKNKTDMAQTFIVEEDSVGEYIGLKDKNGKEEYEGDIIIGSNPDQPTLNKGSIRWDDECAQFILWGETEDISFDIPLYMLDEIEIIGNIYENPELLDKPPSKGGDE